MPLFYAMTIQPTLFGGWAVVRNWGRIGTTGRSRLDIHYGPGEAIDAIGEIKSAKVKRGYQNPKCPLNTSGHVWMPPVLQGLFFRMRL